MGKKDHEELKILKKWKMKQLKKKRKKWKSKSSNSYGIAWCSKQLKNHEKRNKVGGLNSDFKTCLKAIVIQMLCYWNKDQWNRIKSAEINLYVKVN